MRALIWIVAALAALWGGYWFVGSRAAEATARDWFAQAEQGGAVAQYADLQVAGFPNRFDLTVSEPYLADPVQGIGWRAPFAQVFSMSWKPWHLIAALPETQTLDLPGQRVAVTTTRMQGSLVLEPGTALALDQSALLAEEVALRSDLGWQLGWERLNLATRPDPGRADAHEVGLRITGFSPDPALIAALGGLPATVEMIELNLIADLSAPLDRNAGATLPVVEALVLHEGIVRWGGLSLFAKGEVTPDVMGRAEGRIDLRLENWREAMAAAQAMGLIAPELERTVDTVLSGLAAQGGKGDVLELPLTFRNGMTSLGPLPLGPAPMLR